MKKEFKQSGTADFPEKSGLLKMSFLCLNRRRLGRFSGNLRDPGHFEDPV